MKTTTAEDQLAVTLLIKEFDPGGKPGVPGNPNEAGRFPRNPKIA